MTRRTLDFNLAKERSSLMAGKMRSDRMAVKTRSNEVARNPRSNQMAGRSESRPSRGDTEGRSEARADLMSLQTIRKTMAVQRKYFGEEWRK